MTIEEIVEQFGSFRMDKVVSSHPRKKIAEDGETVIDHRIEVTTYHAFCMTECAGGDTFEDAVNNLAEILAKRGNKRSSKDAVLLHH
jgi:hypothetical protein